MQCTIIIKYQLTFAPFAVNYNHIVRVLLHPNSNIITEIYHVTMETIQQDLHQLLMLINYKCRYGFN